MNFDQIAESEREEIMNTIRAKLYQYDREQLREIGITIGRSYSCLIAIRSGRSKWPRAHTIFPLAIVLGLKFTLIDRQDGYTAKSTKTKPTHFHDGSNRSLQ